jgi:hypothetical protein
MLILFRKFLHRTSSLPASGAITNTTMPDFAPDPWRSRLNFIVQLSVPPYVCTVHTVVQLLLQLPGRLR